VFQDLVQLEFVRLVRESIVVVAVVAVTEYYQLPVLLFYFEELKILTLEELFGLAWEDCRGFEVRLDLLETRLLVEYDEREL